MDRTAPGGRAARLLAVLAVLLGLLAMHGLASSHHSLASAATPVAAAAPSTQDPAPGTQGHHATHGAPGQLAVAAAALLPGTATPDGAPDEDCTGCGAHSAAVLCLAVLFTGLALLALLIARRARTGGLPAAPQRLPPLRAGPPTRGRPPDPVSQLCVSRT